MNPISPFDAFIRQVDGFRSTPPGVGVSRSGRCFCPAHQKPPHEPGRGRTLSVAESGDGMLLVHCHAGCGAGEVLASVDLAEVDMFPQSFIDRYRAARQADPKHREADLLPTAGQWMSAAAANDAIQLISLQIINSQTIEEAHTWSHELLRAASEFTEIAKGAMRANRRK